METILRLLPALACPIMMGLLIWAISRNNTNNITTVTDMNVQRAPSAQGEQEPYRVTAANTSPFRAVADMIKCCLNPKVLAGLAVAGVGVLGQAILPIATNRSLTDNQWCSSGAHSKYE